jgi:thioredoxin reductase
MSKNNVPHVLDITFVGAGPSGLFEACHAGLREMTIKIIDALPQAGGQLITLYLEKLIYETPGVWKQSAGATYRSTIKWRRTFPVCTPRATWRFRKIKIRSI